MRQTQRVHANYLQARIVRRSNLRNVTQPAWWLSLGLAALLSACGAETTGSGGIDGGSNDGGGTLTDAVADTGTATDSGTTADITGVDAGTQLDSGTKPDGGSVTDAGTTTACQLSGGTGSGAKGNLVAGCNAGLFCKSTANLCGGAGVCSPLPTVCPSNYAPVCGCDGKTYGNGCTANAAGANVAKTGACPITNACDVPGKSTSKKADGGFDPPMNTCSAKQFCGGSCGAKGTCKTKPTACDQVYAPVCGCDGKTYSNTCGANAAGISVDYKGKCKITPTACTVFTKGATPGGGMPAPSSCSAAQFCKLPDTHCSGQGSCTDLPKGMGCSAQYDPVCGCDGKTYGNACSAGLVGANIESKGACKPTPTGCCKSSVDCGLGGVCVGGDANGNGVCKSMGNPSSGACWSNTQCTGGAVCVGAQVCPCKAACFAPDKAGTCQKPTSMTCTIGAGGQSTDCGAANYCKLAQANTCGGTGTCTEKPQACTMQYAPVCGCDGKTYGNACSASGSGQNVSNVGKCGAP